jgi:glycosyltransferase involved in cell wall biosynthesis
MTGVSGAEKYLLDLLPALKKLGINCELICICPKENRISLLEYCSEMERNGIKTTLLTTASKISYINIAGKIAGYIKSNNIQAVHSHLFSADLITVLVKKIYFKHLITLSTKHGYEEEYLIQYGLGNKKIRHNLYYYITKYLINNTTHNLAVSHSLSRLYFHLRLGKKEMPYIHHGINVQPAVGKSIFINGNPKILMVGRLSVIKGHTYLIQALPEIIKKFPSIKVILVGDGPLKNDLINEATALQVIDHIKFAGFAKPGDYSQECQVMVLPSLFESFGLVYIESFALKIPVIAFDAEAGNEIIENNKTGILVPKKDIKALAEKIIYLLESPAESHRIVENAYNKYLTYYNAERMAKQTLEWYQSVLGR